MTPAKPTIFVGGPFSVALKESNDKRSFDKPLRKYFTIVHDAVRQIGANLLSAHITDGFGEDEWEENFVQRDIKWVKQCDVYLVLLPLDCRGTPYRTDGTFIEIGLAIAFNKPVVLVVEQIDHPDHSYFVRNLDREQRVRFVDWDTFFRNDPITSLKALLRDQGFSFSNIDRSESVARASCA